MIHGRAPRGRRRRALAHQCPSCRRHWALKVIEHPSGKVVLCRHCGAVRRPEPVVTSQSPG